MKQDKYRKSAFEPLDALFEFAQPPLEIETASSAEVSGWFSGQEKLDKYSLIQDATGA